ncbi:hypothetical protein QEN19_001798 [Hanseniaspora menglaensis]
MSTEVPLIIDNGSYKLKFGFANEPNGVKTVHNCIVKTKSSFGDKYCLGNQLEDPSILTSTTNAYIKRSKEFGQLTSWEAQSEIWDYCFYNPSDFGFDLNEHFQKKGIHDIKTPHLILSETIFHIPELSKNTDEVIFEEYAFSSLYKAPAAAYIPFNREGIQRSQVLLNSNDNIVSSNNEKEISGENYNKFQLVIDSGFDCTWVIPIINGTVFYEAVQKCNFGGKFFTGYLKELISYRHIDLSQETLIVNKIKEKCLFMAPESFNKSLLELSEKKIVKEYVLPSDEPYIGATSLDKEIDSNLGYLIQTGEKPANNRISLKLSDELFTVPETMIFPEKVKFDSSLTMTSHSLIEVINKSLNLCPEVLRPLLISNIVLIGGNFNIPNMKERILKELQLNSPTEWTVRISGETGKSDLFAFESMCKFSTTEEYRQARVTREEYLENGLEWSSRKRFGFQAFI